MDLMATPASVQKVPGSEGEGTAALPFYSRYRTLGCARVDVPSHDVSQMPSSSSACFGFCFSPTGMVAVVLQHLVDCKARAVIVVPDHKQTWFPLLSNGTVKSTKFSEPGGRSPFSRVHHQRGREEFTFKRWGMRTVEVNFAENG